MIPTYLLDTNVWVDLLRSKSKTIRQKIDSHRNWVVGLSVISLCELQFGIDLQAVRHPHLRARQQQLLATAIAPFQLFPVTKEVVQSYGKLRAHLQVSGNTIGALDTLIAAQALSLEATVVTSNLQEFRRVPNLRIEDWR